MGVYGGPEIINDGLVLYLDAGNTKSYSGSGNTWIDLAGNGNDGTLTNGPTYSSTNGGYFSFDGTNDYVTSSLSISGRPFTINFWIYFNSLTGWQTIVGQDTSQATALGRFYFQKTNNTNNISPRINNTVGLALITDSNAEVYCYDSTTVQTSTWYNYCVSVSNTTLILYKNGAEVTNVSNSSNLAAATGNTTFSVGYYNNALADYVNGRVPICQIYNRALTAAEIQQNFNAMRGRFGI